MKEFRKYSLLVVVTYFVFLILKRNGVVLPEVFQNYLTDVLCLPATLIVIRAIIRTIHRDAELQLSIPMVVVAFVSFSILFEWILPQRSLTYTADVLDVLAYAIGGVAYILFTHQQFLGIKKSTQ